MVPNRAVARWVRASYWNLKVARSNYSKCFPGHRDSTSKIPGRGVNFYVWFLESLLCFFFYLCLMSWLKGHFVNEEKIHLIKVIDFLKVSLNFRISLKLRGCLFENLPFTENAYARWLT